MSNTEALRAAAQRALAWLDQEAPIAVDDAIKEEDEIADALRAAMAESQRDWSLLEATQDSLREHMQEIHKLRADAERYAWLKRKKIRPIYRPGHPRIEHYIDGQTIAWSSGEQSYSDAIDAAIDATITKDKT